MNAVTRPATQRLAYKPLAQVNVPAPTRRSARAWLAEQMQVPPSHETAWLVAFAVITAAMYAGVSLGFV